MMKNADKRGLKHRPVRIKRPTFILVVAVSLDGKITNGKKEGTEWTSKEDQKFFRGELDRADAVILGRKTFEAIPRPLTPRNRIVFSHTKTFSHFAEYQNVKVFKGGENKLLTLLQKMRWKRIVIAGGTEIYEWFLHHKIVDEIYLTVEPVTVGSGKPFLSNFRTMSNWQLTSVKMLNSRGTVVLHYSVR